MAQWVKRAKCEELSLNPQNPHKSGCDNECVCMILTPCLRWNVKRGSCLEAFQPVSLTHTAMDKRACLKAEAKGQPPRCSLNATHV